MTALGPTPRRNWGRTRPAARTATADSCCRRRRRCSLAPRGGPAPRSSLARSYRLAVLPVVPPIHTQTDAMPSTLPSWRICNSEGIAIQGEAPSLQPTRTVSLHVDVQSDAKEKKIRTSTELNPYLFHEISQTCTSNIMVIHF